MKHVFLKKAKEVFLLCFLAFLLPLPSIAGQFISSEDSLLDERAVGKMEEIAQELFKTTGVKAFLVAKKSAQGKEIVAFEKEFTHYKHLKFYDSKNKCAYDYLGNREGFSYDNYEPFEGNYPDWALEAFQTLER